MTGNKYIIDSSAWIEYISGSETGKKVKAIIEGNNNIILTPSIVVAEVISKIIRLEKNATEAKIAIKMLSKQPMEEWTDYIEAGELHPEMRKKHKEISLADTIIKVIADKNWATIVTKDAHLKGKNAILI